MVQLKEPSFGVLEDNVWTTTPAFNTSIFIYEPTDPDDVQVIAWVEPRTQDSPLFGEVMAIEPVDTTDEVPEVKAKLALLVSVIAVLVVLVIRIR
jgi:hypothetical protein